MGKQVHHKKTLSFSRKGYSLLFCALLVFSSTGTTRAEINAKDTPLGMGFVLANYPNSTLDDLQDAIGKAAIVGGHLSFVWSWRKTESLALIERVVPVARAVGLDILMQVAPTALGEPSPPVGLPYDWADPSLRERFLADVERVAQMQPEYLNLCAEVNLMYHFHPDQFAAFAPIYREAYDLVKAISPETQVGFSMLDLLWIGYQQWTIPGQLGFDSLDFIAFTSYPDPLFYDGRLGVDNIDDIPADWYSAARTVYPDIPILITELGWTTRRMGSEPDQAQFIQNLPRLFADLKPELVTWTVLSDISFFDPAILPPEAVQFLEDLGVDPAELFDRFNGMGLFTTTAQVKPGWFRALELVLPQPEVVTPQAQ
ncbi:MAG: hypothetical protein VX663_00345 [Pseudomonadota bacterium]|nr:hypothetical protein [Pseudomonadota bacterium]